MTREDWRRVEPVATQALAMSPDDQRALIESAGLGEPIRFELLAALQRIRQSSRVAVAATPTPTPLDGADRHGASPRPPLPVLTPGLPLDEGRYIVVRQIGRGGMGTVFLANDTKLGMLVALKVTLHDERVLDEARRAAACSGHPHVATIHNVFDQDIHGRKVGVLVMEYVAGTPASRILDDGPVAITRALRWARQVAEAIAHAHDHQVLHCDLKPANIIITPEDNAKVLDFGIARATFDPSDPGEPLRGTIPYMAPEQLVAKEFSAAGDIYSLGVTLFELITGRLPFEGDDAALRLRIVVAPPPNVMDLVPGVPPQLHGVIDRALAKEPQRRYRSARSFERALDSVETGVHHSTATIPAPVPASTPTSVWSKVGVATVAAAVVVAGMVALGWLTSWVFNTTLERGDFANESVADWLMWGRRTSMAPLIWTLILAGATVPLAAAWRVAMAGSRSARRAGDSVQARVTDVAIRYGLGDASTRAWYVVLASGSAVAVALVLFSPLILTVLDFVSRAPADKLAILAPDRGWFHSFYRGAFTTIIIATGLSWFSVLELTRRGQRVSSAALVSGALVLLVAIVLLHIPYRLVNYRTDFEVVNWNGAHCYVTGESADDVLLFCPDITGGRKRIIAKDDDLLIRSRGIETNLFTRFSQATPSAEPAATN